MTELKPCPFCGVMPHIYWVMPHIYWEAWKDISPDAGVWKLEANHKDSCYITHINGTNISGRSSARRLSQLVEWWNHREELFGNSEQLESGHEKDHVADPGKMVGDLISRQAAINALWKALYEYEDVTEKQFIESEELDVGDWFQHRIFVQNMSDIDRQTILALPSAQPEIKPIDYQDCANAMMKMWMDNVLTDGEYNRIMDKLNKHEMERRKADERSDL